MGKAARIARQQRKMEGRRNRAFENEIGMTRDEYNLQLEEEAKAHYANFRQNIGYMKEAKDKLREVVRLREKLESEHPDKGKELSLKKDFEKYFSWTKEEKELSDRLRKMEKNPRVMTSNSFGYEYENTLSRYFDGPWRKEPNRLPETLTNLNAVREKIKAEVDKNEVISGLFERLRELKKLLGSTSLFLNGISTVLDIEYVWDEV